MGGIFHEAVSVPPALVLCVGLKTPQLKKMNYEMLRRTSDLDGFFGIIEVNENGHEIWHMEACSMRGMRTEF
jgi:hypothetical protein